MDVRRFVKSVGGFVTTAQLRAAGFGERRVRKAVSSGELFRLKRGWFTSRSPSEPEARSISAGGRLTGGSAIEALGGWVWRRPSLLQVSVAANASRVAIDPPGIQLHWESLRSPPSSHGIVGLPDALVRLTLDSDLETAVAAFDWALRSGRLDRFEVERTILHLPERARVISLWIDEKSQSVLESVARTRLLSRGWSVRSQVAVADIQAIDLVVNDVVALELDGREFHESGFEGDRRKDLAITLEGRHAIRVSRSMLQLEWPRIERAIERALQARASDFSGVALPQPRGSRRRPGSTASNP